MKECSLEPAFLIFAHDAATFAIKLHLTLTSPASSLVESFAFPVRRYVDVQTGGGFVKVGVAHQMQSNFICVP